MKTAILLLFSVFSVSAQQAKLDSFKKTLLLKNLTDSAIVSQSCNFYIGFSELNYKLANDALLELRNKNFGAQNALFYTKINYALGVTNHIKVDYLKAIINYQESLNYSNKINDIKSKNLILSRLLSNLGLAYLGINDYENGYNYLKQSIGYNKNSSDSLALIKNYQLIAYVAEVTKNDTEAFKYYELALTYRKFNKTLPEVTLTTLVDWMKISFKNNKFKNLEKGVAIADSLKKAQSLKNEALMGYNKIKGFYSKYKKDYSKALYYYELAYRNALIRNYPPEIANVLENIAEIYSFQNKPNLAVEYYDKALAIALKVDHNLQLEIINNYVFFSEKNGEIEKAYGLLKRKETLTDSLYSIQNHNRIVISESLFKTEQKETKIKELEGENSIKSETLRKRNVIITSLVASILLLSFFGYLAYKNLKYRKQIADNEINTLKKEKELSATEAVLKGETQERSRMAKDLHDGLGGMLSGIKLNLSAMRGNQIVQEQDANIFNRSIDQLDEAIKEMRRVAHNMMPEALLKFGLNEAVQDFCDGINMSNGVKMKFVHLGQAIPKEQSLQVILYRIIQELSNNALKYAQAKNIFIQLTGHEKGISLTVEDDGKGFDTSKLAQNRGAGLQNVESRVSYLKGEFTIESKIGEGTTCNVEIPG